MKFISYLSLIAAITVICGCVSAPFVPPQGFLFTSLKAPLTIDFESTPVCNKSGSAKETYCMACHPACSFAWGDCSIEAAKKDGKLTEIGYADYEILNILGFWRETTVTAYGR